MSVFTDEDIRNRCLIGYDSLVMEKRGKVQRQLVDKWRKSINMCAEQGQSDPVLRVPKSS